jgi:hypothetical protein
MSELVSNVVKVTLKKNGHAIKLFEDILTRCEFFFFFFGLEEAEYHETSLTRGNATYIRQMSKKQKEYCLYN